MSLYYGPPGSSATKSMHDGDTEVSDAESTLDFDSCSDDDGPDDEPESYDVGADDRQVIDAENLGSIALDQPAVPGISSDSKEMQCYRSHVINSRSSVPVSSHLLPIISPALLQSPSHIDPGIMPSLLRLSPPEPVSLSHLLAPGYVAEQKQPSQIPPTGPSTCVSTTAFHDVKSLPPEILPTSIRSMPPVLAPLPRVAPPLTSTLRTRPLTIHSSADYLRSVSAFLSSLVPDVHEQLPSRLGGVTTIADSMIRRRSAFLGVR